MKEHIIVPETRTWKRFEGVTDQIKASLKKAGGDALLAMVYETKVKNGSTCLTQIHHRETPMFLMQGRAEAGVTWRSEAIFQEQAGNPIAHVDIPDAENTMGIYAGGIVKGAAHREAAREVARLSQITRGGENLRKLRIQALSVGCTAGTAVLQR